MWRLALAVASLLATEAGSKPVPPSALPLRTRGTRIVGATGERVRLNCVNWYGAHLEQMVMNGLNRQPLDDIAKDVAEFGFNCVRLPYSLDLISDAAVVPNPEVTLEANPHLHGLSPLHVFDATVKALTDKGLVVILNNHISTAQWCCTLVDGEGLWYTSAYNETRWLDMLGFMAARYRDNSLVAGFDLRNELRPSYLGTPTWGSGVGASDWAAAALRGAERVLAADGDLLIIVSGLWFGLFLCDVPHRPLHLEPMLRHRTVYTSHEYPWLNFHLASWWVIGTFFIALAVWTCILWFALILSWILEHRGHIDKDFMPNLLARIVSCGRRRASSPRTRRWCPSKCWCGGRFQRCCGHVSNELGFAVVLTVISVISLVCTPRFAGSCGAVNMAASMGLTFLAFACMAVSLLLFMRVALSTVAGVSQDYNSRAHQQGEGVEGQGSTSPSSPPRTSTCIDVGIDMASVREIARSRLHLGCSDGDDAREQQQELPPVDLHLHRQQDSQQQLQLPRVGGSDRATPLAGAETPSSADAASVVSSSLHAWPTTPRAAEEGRQTQTRARGAWCLRACVRKFRSTRFLIMGLTGIMLGLLLYIRDLYGEYEVFEAELDRRWGFLLGSGGENETAPVWIGEFGTKEDDLYWAHILRYIREKDADWAYWSLNGEKRANRTEYFGLVMEDAKTVRQPWKLQALQELINMTVSDSSSS